MKMPFRLGVRAHTSDHSIKTAKAEVALQVPSKTVPHSKFKGRLGSTRLYLKKKKKNIINQYIPYSKASN